MYRILCAVMQAGMIAGAVWFAVQLGTLDSVAPEDELGAALRICCTGVATVCCLLLGLYFHEKADAVR